MTYLADDADISSLMTSMGTAGVEGSTEELRLLISLLEAQGYEQMVQPCEELGSSAAGATLRCTFDFHDLGSDEIGLGPYTGSSFDLTVRDGEIVEPRRPGAGRVSPQMWEPFASWVSTRYPEDAMVMYEDESHSGARLTEASIELWSVGPASSLREARRAGGGRRAFHAGS